LRALERGSPVARQGTTAATVGGGENVSAGFERVSRAVSDALTSMQDSTVSEQDVGDDAKKYDVQVGDENVVVNIGGAVDQ
jgi:hypothetical protein